MFSKYAADNRTHYYSTPIPAPGIPAGEAPCSRESRIRWETIQVHLLARRPGIAPALCSVSSPLIVSLYLFNGTGMRLPDGSTLAQRLRRRPRSGPVLSLHFILSELMRFAVPLIQPPLLTITWTALGFYTSSSPQCLYSASKLHRRFYHVYRKNATMQQWASTALQIQKAVSAYIFHVSRYFILALQRSI